MVSGLTQRRGHLSEPSSGAHRLASIGYSPPCSSQHSVRLSTWGAQLPKLLALERPEGQTAYWPSMRKLAARGLPDARLFHRATHRVDREAAPSGETMEVALQGLVALPDPAEAAARFPSVGLGA